MSKSHEQKIRIAGIIQKHCKKQKVDPERFLKVLIDIPGEVGLSLLALKQAAQQALFNSQIAELGEKPKPKRKPGKKS